MADSERIVIVPYNPEWKSLFAKEKKLLQTHLQGEYKSIMHIGSTSIEGLDAKPLVDISVAVNELKPTAFYNEKLLPIGYKHCNGGKFQEWILYEKADSNGQEYHLHMMQYDSIRLFKQIMFKIFLEENPDVADLYVRKKKAYLVLDDHIWYSMNKKPFVNEVNCYALQDAIDDSAYWSNRIKEIMGYVPHAELFEVDNPALKQAQYYCAWKLDKKDKSLGEMLEITGLTENEMVYFLV